MGRDDLYNSLFLESTEEELGKAVEYMKKEFAYRAYAILGQTPPIVEVRHGPYVFVICNVTCTDIDEDGNLRTRLNVQGWYDWQHDGNTHTITGGLLPILYPCLIGKIKIIDG